MMTLDTFMQELDMLLRARTPLIAVRSTEEERASKVIYEVARTRKYGVRLWSIISGFVDPDSKDEVQVGMMRDAQQDIMRILSDKGRCVYVMRDMAPWMQPQNPMAPVLIRSLKEVAAGISRDKSIILLGSTVEVPPSLESDMVVLDLPRPDRRLMSIVLDETVDSLADAKAKKSIKGSLDRDALVSAALGLTAKEAQNCYLRAILSTKGVSMPPAVVTGEKKRIIERSGVLTWVEPEGGLEMVGGLDIAKQWLLSRANVFGQEAQNFGLDPIKGMLSFGKPGTGKSLLAKLAGSAWRVPVLGLTVDRIKDMYQGKSQQNLRKVFEVAEAVAPCVLYIDEFDKLIGGMSGSSSMTDGGTGSDMLSQLLGWMQDKKSQVFIAGAANRGKGLPSEILRKGRFDVLWLVDLPNIVERPQIFEVHLRKRGRDPEKFDVEGLAAESEGFSGAEIEACVAEALVIAFNDGHRELTTDDIRVCIRGTTPQSAAPEIANDLEEMRQWAKAYCTLASTPIATGRGGIAGGTGLGQKGIEL